MSRNQYVNDLAATIYELYAEGIKDPSALQITRRYWGEDKAVTNGMIEEVRAKLGRIRQVLHEGGYLTCPLSATYYKSFRKPGRLATREEARRCLPTRGLQQTGVLFLDGAAEADLIWTEWAELQCNQAAGKAKRSTDNVFAAVDKGKMTHDQAREILAQSRQLATPERRELEHAIFAPPAELTS